MQLSVKNLYVFLKSTTRLTATDAMRNTIAVFRGDNEFLSQKLRQVDFWQYFKILLRPLCKTERTVGRAKKNLLQIYLVKWHLEMVVQQFLALMAQIIYIERQ